MASNDVYEAYHQAVDQLKADLAELEKLNFDMDFPNWGDVGSMKKHAIDLREIRDQIMRKGEYAA